MNKRYVVVEGSQSSHCCFDATVVDTSKPFKHDAARFEQVCECFEIEDAEKIAEALNRSCEDRAGS